MLLLDDNSSGIMANWVSAAMALGTLVIAIITAVQTKKIKELGDIVQELKEHTNLFRQTYFLELDRLRKTTEPSFKIQSISNRQVFLTSTESLITGSDQIDRSSYIERWEATFTIINVGDTAEHVFLDDFKDRGVSYYFQQLLFERQHMMSHGDKFVFTVKAQRNPNFAQELNYGDSHAMWLYFANKVDRSFVQQIVYDVHANVFLFGGVMPRDFPIIVNHKKNKDRN